MKWMPKSFENAQEILGHRDHKKIGNNTELRREGNTYVVRHFSTDIVRYHADGDVYFDLTYPSVSTKARLNKAHPMVRITHRDHTLHVCYKGMVLPVRGFFRTSEATDELEPVE